MKVSIITATYNSEIHIKSAIESITNQTYKGVEWIVIDGGSQDNTISIIKEHFNGDLKILSEEDDGIYHALNKGISLATGDIIGFLHSDDFLFSSNVIQQIINEFSKTDCDGVYGDLNYVSSLNVDKIIRNWKSKSFKSKYLSQGWMPAHPTLFLKKKIYQDFGVFDINYRIAADYDLICRIFKIPTLKFNYIPHVITCMRVGGVSNKFGNILLKMKEDLLIINKNKLGNSYFVLLRKNLSKIKQFLYAKI